MEFCRTTQTEFCNQQQREKSSYKANSQLASHAFDGFGGLVVSMLASSTQVCGFKPGRSRWIFRA